jgi:hypothetical protein
MALNSAYQTARLRHHQNLLRRIIDQTDHIDVPPGFPPGKVIGEVSGLGLHALHCTDMMTQNFFGVQPRPNLPEYIHPIFAYSDRWNIPPWHHNRMRLGLQLASQLLLSPPAMNFFSKVLFAEVATDSQGREYLREFILTKPLMHRTRQILNETALYIEFDFADLGEFFEEGATHAETDCQHPRQRLVPVDLRCEHYAGVQGLPMLITFNHRVVNNFALTADADFDLRVQFHFANTLLHELAHAVFYLARLKVVNPPSLENTDVFPFAIPTPKEPRFHQHTFLNDVEFGLELELALFDRIVMSAGTTILPSYGLWAEAVIAGEAAERKRQLVPMAWVTWWFRADSMQLYSILGRGALPPMTDFWYSYEDGSLEIVPE